MELKRIKAARILFSVKFYFITINDFLVIIWKSRAKSLFNKTYANLQSKLNKYSQTIQLILFCYRRQPHRYSYCYPAHIRSATFEALLPLMGKKSSKSVFSEDPLGKFSTKHRQEVNSLKNKTTW